MRSAHAASLAILAVGLAAILALSAACGSTGSSTSAQPPAQSAPQSTSPPLSLTPALPPATAPNSDWIRHDAFRGQFELRGSPVPGQPVDLVFSIEPLLDMQGVSIRILLPAGVQLLGGDPSWQGDVAAGERLEHVISIATSESGEWMIRAAVTAADPAGLDRVYFAELVSDPAGGELRAPSAEPAPSPPVLSATIVR